MFCCARGKYSLLIYFHVSRWVIYLILNAHQILCRSIDNKTSPICWWFQISWEREYFSFLQLHMLKKSSFIIYSSYLFKIVPFWLHVEPPNFFAHFYDFVFLDDWQQLSLLNRTSAKCCPTLKLQRQRWCLKEPRFN